MDFIIINLILYTISSLFIKQSWCLPSNFHSKNIEIDEFINKLLTSEKFNDLADFIAEKAAKKIKNMNKYQAKQITIKKDDMPNETQSLENTAEETLTQSEEQSVYKTGYSLHEIKHRNEYAKINPQTYRQTDAILPSEELSLKYKHFTKGVHGTINNDKLSSDNYTEFFNNDKTNPHKNIDENINREHFQPTVTSVVYNKNLNIYLKQHQNKTNKFSNMVTSSEYTNINTEKQQNKLPEEIADEKKFQSQENIYSVLSQKHVREASDNEREHDNIKQHYLHLTAKGQPEIIRQSTDTETDRDGSVTKTLLDIINKKTNQQRSEEESERTKEETFKRKHVLKYPEGNQDNTTSNENGDHIKENVELEGNLSEMKTDKPNKTKHIRKEGNKVFTFESSPDYDEYHETIAKVHGTHVNSN